MWQGSTPKEEHHKTKCQGQQEWMNKTNFKFSQAILQSITDNGFLQISHRRERNRLSRGILLPSRFIVQLNVVLKDIFPEPGASMDFIINNWGLPMTLPLLNTIGS
jgi:hypothetical protein